jgi:hypothetical protein
MYIAFCCGTSQYLIRYRVSKKQQNDAQNTFTIYSRSAFVFENSQVFLFSGKLRAGVDMSVDYILKLQKGVHDPFSIKHADISYRISNNAHVDIESLIFLSFWALLEWKILIIGHILNIKILSQHTVLLCATRHPSL